MYRVLQRLSSGRLKVWFAEFRLYRRDEKGKVVRERDHLMEATRYLEMELLNICRTEPKKESLEWLFNHGLRGGGTWMG